MGPGSLEGDRVAGSAPSFCDGLQSSCSSGKKRSSRWMPVYCMGHKQSSGVVIFSVEEDSLDQQAGNVLRTHREQEAWLVAGPALNWYGMEED